MLTRPFDIIVLFISCEVYASETIHRPLSERFHFVWKNRLFRWKIKRNGPFYLKFFGEKRMGFPRFYRNYRNITVPFARSYLCHAPWSIDGDGEWMITRSVCGKVLFHIWRKMFTGFPYKWKALLPIDFACGKIALFHLAEVLTALFEDWNSDFIKLSKKKIL